MKQILGFTTITSVIVGINSMAIPVATAEQPLYLAYPPKNHQTTSEKIFLIGTASPVGEVSINGQPIQRSKAGHFAPSFPLKVGDNIFTLRYKNREIRVKVTRTASALNVPIGMAFAKDSLVPTQRIARLPDELICFSAIAPENATVSVKLGTRAIALLPQSQAGELLSNADVLTASERSTTTFKGLYQGCSAFSQVGNLGKPSFQLSVDSGKTIAQQSTGDVEILAPNQLEIVEVTANAGVARTGPGTDYSRLTPLPKGTKASVTGIEGDWLRLDYGGWIKREETRSLPDKVPPKSLIRGVSYRQVNNTTEIIFPLQVPVPIAIQQGEKNLTLTLYNTTAQTDTIKLNDDPIIKRLDWQQIAPGQVQYSFNLKHEQQWGYDVKYQGTNLVLSLRHPPKIQSQSPTPLKGITILLDPGHGGTELGAKGPTGYPEKDINLVVSKLLKQELIKRGATIYMTRESDREVSLEKRVAEIDRLKPTLALSIHYNALPDNGDAINTKGVGIFWYHAQGHDLSIFLHDYLVKKLNRPSYGVYWNNLALTRPHSAPSILLELGFMINPNEFEWISKAPEQEKLAQTLADGIVEWFQKK